jgi:DNA-binding MarR family transcriptional regulator
MITNMCEVIERHISSWRDSNVTSDLTWRTLQILVALGDRQFVTKDLAAYAKLSKPCISRNVANLERFGLVRRRINEQDRRTPFIEITAAGVIFLDEICGAITRQQVKKAA